MLKISELGHDEKSSFLSRYDTFIFDLDGVIWELGVLIDGSSDVLKKLHDAGKRIIFLTNNCVTSRDFLFQRLKTIYPQAEKENVLTAAYLTAQYLKGVGFNKKVYLLGSQGLKEELTLAGIECVGDEPILKDLSELTKRELDKDVGGVVLGFVTNLNALNITKALNYLSDPNCLYVASHLDILAKFGSWLVPCAGMMASALKAATGRWPILVGKPSDFTKKFLLGLGLDPNRCLFTGDSQEVDIGLGNACGMSTLLVGSNEVETGSPEPTYCTNRLLDILPLLQPDA